jgi:hypothetical protein
MRGDIGLYFDCALSAGHALNICRDPDFGRNLNYRLTSPWDMSLRNTSGSQVLPTESPGERKGGLS